MSAANEHEVDSSAESVGTVGKSAVEQWTMQQMRPNIKVAVENIEENGRKQIRQAFNDPNNEDPWRTIKSLQDRLNSFEYSIMEPAIQSLQLLSGHSKTHLYSQLLDHLRSRLDAKLQRADDAILLQMLQQTIQFFAVAELKPVPLSILKRLTRIPERILNLLIEKRYIEECALDVKRQAWLVNKKYFLQKMDELCASCTNSAIHKKEVDRVIRQLCDSIKSSEALLRILLDHFSDSAKYCSEVKMGSISPSAADGASSTVLRVGWPALAMRIIIGVNEAGARMQSVEKIGDLALLLDRCKRQGRVDPNALNQIFQTFKSLINAQATLDEREFAKTSEEYFRKTGEYPPGYHNGDVAPLASGLKRKLPGTAVAHKNSEGLLRKRHKAMEEAYDKSDSGISYNIDGTDRSHLLTPVDLRAILKEAIDYLAKCDEFGTFAMEITDAIAPQYSKIVKYPMWIPKMRERLGKNGYRSLAELDADVELMFMNCEMYNGPISDYTKFAKDLRRKWKSKLNGTLMKKVGRILANPQERHGSSNVTVPVIKVNSRVNKAITAGDSDEEMEFDDIVQPPRANARQSTKILDEEDVDVAAPVAVPQVPSVKAATEPAPMEVVDSGSDGEEENETKKKQSIKQDTRRQQLSDDDDKESNDIGRKQLVRNVTDRSTELPLAQLTPLMVEGWNVLTKNDPSALFAYPVEDEIAPGYSKKIKQPMDLQTIKGKIQKGDYSSLQPMHQDVLLMFRNCRQFNKEGPIVQAANALSNIWSSTYASLKKRVESMLKKELQQKQKPKKQSVPASAPTAAHPVTASSESGLSALEQVMYEGLEFMMKLDENKIFLNKITDEIAPDYSVEIETPMWMELIGRKIKAHKYTTLDAVDKDMTLIFKNCEKYNGKSDPISETANKYLAKWKRKLVALRNQAEAAAKSKSAAPKPTSTDAARSSKSETSKGSKSKSAAHVVSSGDQKSSDMLRKLMMDGVQFINKMDKEKVFLEAVTDAVAPQYSTIIKKPMYMNLIEKRIASGKYQSLSEMDTDVKLMFDNCKLYNKGYEPLFKLAQDFQMKWDSKFLELKEQAGAKTASETAKLPTAAPPSDDSALPSGPVVVDDIKFTEEAASRRRPLLSKLSVTALEKLKEVYAERSLQSGSANITSAVALQDVLNAAMNFLSAEDKEKIFAKPVTDAEVPGYSKIIKNKLAFSNMRTKISRREYPDLGAFSSDLKLIISNCMTFNPRGTPYYQAAVRLRDSWSVFYFQAIELFPHMAPSSPCQEATTAGDGSIDAVESGAGADVIEAEERNPPPGTYHHNGQRIKLPYILDHAMIETSYPEIMDKSVDSRKSASVQRSLMLVAWNYITELDEGGVFSYPVGTQEYTALIKSPMDLSTIRVKIDRKKYKTLKEFDDDVRLMFNNCYEYNPNRQEYYQVAEKLDFAWYFGYMNLQSLVRNQKELELTLPSEHTENSSAAGAQDSTASSDKERQQETSIENAHTEVADVGGAAVSSAVAEVAPIVDGVTEEVADLKGSDNSDSQRESKDDSNEKSSIEKNSQAVISAKSATEDNIQENSQTMANTACSQGEIKGAAEESVAMDIDGAEKDPSDSNAQTHVADGVPRNDSNSHNESSHESLHRKDSEYTAGSLSLNGSEKKNGGGPSEDKNRQKQVATEVVLSATAGNSGIARKVNDSNDTDGPPQPSAALISSRAAVKMLRQPELLHGSDSSATNNPAVPDLPPIIAVQQLRWGLLLLHDMAVQALLRKQLAISLLEIVSKHLGRQPNTTGNANVAFATSSRSLLTSEQSAIEIRLPFEDLSARRIFQLCQISYSGHVQLIPALDHRTLRVVLPSLLLHFCRDHHESKEDTSRNHTEEAERSAALTAKAQSLVSQTLQDVAAQLGNVEASEESCFAHQQVLQELLESITKHMLSMIIKS